jgi:8-oxo-dGTP pyrophosphatase MutT (NUDIX family)
VAEPAAKTVTKHASAAALLLLDDALRAHVSAQLAGFNRHSHESPSLHRAAVAVVLIDEAHGADLQGLPQHAAPSHQAALLLTRRSAQLRKHAGQWALPGGRMDAGESPEQTALRELHEEVGLQLGAAQVLGRLDDFSTRSGYCITPVVVWAGRVAELQLNPAEVQSAHRIPVSEFLRADAPMLEDIPGSAHPVLRMPVGNNWIAAPTAAVLYQFRELCLLGRETRVAHFEQPRFAWK